MKNSWKIICAGIIIAWVSYYIYSSIEAKSKYDRETKEADCYNWKLNENNDLNKVLAVKDYTIKHDFPDDLLNTLVLLGYTKDLDGYIKAVYTDKIRPYSFLNSWMNKKETIRMRFKEINIITSGNGGIIDIVKENNKIKIARFYPRPKVEIIMIQNSDGSVTEYTFIKTDGRNSASGAIKP